MQKKKPILLMDLDNTILDFDTQEAVAITRMLAERGVEATDERLAVFRRINAQHWERLENGTMTRQEVLVGRFSVFFETLGLQLDAQSAQDSYENYLCQGHYFVTGAEALLETIYQDNDLYIISNGNTRVQDARLKSSGIARYFKDIFVSETMGCDKPSREFFSLCFSRIPDFAPERALVIGDSLTSDIRGGMNMGVPTCWFNPKHSPLRDGFTPDYTVYSLDEIPGLIHKHFDRGDKLDE